MVESIDIEVDRARAADVEELVRIRALAVVTSADYDESTNVEEEVRRFLPRLSGYLAGTYHPGHALAARAVFAARSEGAIVGLIAGHQSTRMGCNAELQWMFVHPDHQRRGIGLAMLVPMAQWNVDEGRRHVIVDAPPENRYRAFYLKYGATPLDEYWLHWQDIGAAVLGL